MLVSEVGQLCFQQMAAKKRISSSMAAVTAYGLMMAKPSMHIACPQLSHTAQWDPRATWEESSCYYLSARIAIQSITSYTTVDHQVCRKLWKTTVSHR